jgi:hypothetical protein
MPRTKQPHQLVDGGTRSSLAGIKICFVDAKFELIPKHHEKLPNNWTDVRRAIVDWQVFHLSTCSN